MAVRKCSTCKHYEPAPIWRKGWCRNPLLYSPQQSHLVGEDDLDCDRGMGNYWEPIDQDPDGVTGPGSVNAGYGERTGDTGPTYEERGEVAPLHLRGHRETDERSERRGGDVSQYGGPGRPTGSDDYGTSGDDDRYTQPFSEQGGSDPYGGGGGGGERTPFGYQPEERYWTDYLRIAAPVVGVILMLGLVWFWVANMLGDDNDGDVASDDADTNGPVIPSETEEATPEGDENEDDEEGEPPIGVTTPEGDENGEGNGEGEGEENGEQSPTSLGPGATVVVVGTGEDGLNVRESASTEAEIVDSVPDGTEMTITGESEEAEDFVWWPVETAETSGFVVQEFVELSGE